MKIRLLWIGGLLAVVGGVLLSSRPSTEATGTGDAVPAAVPAPAQRFLTSQASAAPVESTLEDSLRHHLARLSSTMADHVDPEFRKEAVLALALFLGEHPEMLSVAARQMAAEPGLRDRLVHLAETSAQMPEAAVVTLLVQASALELLDSDQDWQRQLGLTALGHSPVTTNIFQTVAALAAADPDPAIRLGAVGTMAVWLAETHGWQEVLGQELNRLVRTAPDRDLRADALRVLIAHQGRLTAELCDLVNAYLDDQPTVAERLMVATAVEAFTEDVQTRDFVLTQLEMAFTEETAVAQKRVILEEMVRLGRSNVLELIQQLPVDDPALAQDVRDYQEILAAGVDDPPAIALGKAERERSRQAIPPQ